MRGPISAFISHRRGGRRRAPLFLCTLAVLACACDASLIDPSEPGLHYTLRDVAGHDLPFELTPMRLVDGQAYRPWLVGGAVLLRPDSSALMVLALGIDSAGTHLDKRVEWPGTYSVGNGSVVFSLFQDSGRPGFERLPMSLLLPFSEEALVFRHLTSFDGYDFRFVRD